MHFRSVSLTSFFFVLSLLAILIAPVRGQTGPDLLVKPWQPEQLVETSTDGLLEAQGHTREDSNNVRLSIYDAVGRYRIFPDSEATPRLGYEVSYMDIGGGDPALPHHLWSTEVGFAQPIARLPKEYFLAVTGAIGYAGNSPFDDPHAVYGAANIIVGRVFNEDKALLIALNYNGNRTFLPDTPIPGFAFANRYSPTLTYVLGLPYSSITYEPRKGFQLEGGISLVTTFEGKLAYQYTKHWSVFGQYTDRLTPFHLYETNPDRRLFFETHQLEAGLRWNPTKLIALSVSGGWAFGQEFSTGYDDRGLNPLRHISDAPFGRVQVQIGF